MSDVPRDISERVPAAASTVHDRCNAIGLPAWVLDPDGAIMVAPAGDGPLGAVVHAPALSNAVSDAISNAEIPRRDPSMSVDLFPGASLLVIPIREMRRAVAHVAILMLTTDATSGEAFAGIVRSAGVDPDAVEQAVAGFAFITSERAERAEKFLAWMAEDLESTTKLTSDLNDFGRQLTDTYEEISLLYKLREGISAETNPANFVDEACRDLLAVTPFKWIGVCFSRERKEARALAGETMLFGAPPCTRENFRYAVDLVAHSLEPGTPRILSGEDRGELACGTSQTAIVPFGKQGSVFGTIVAGGKTNNDDAVTSMEMKLVEAVAGHILVLIENAGLYADQRDTFLGTLQALTTAIDAKDRYTCGHSERVAFLSEQIALAAGMSRHDAERIRISGLVHDVGKIGVPESVLRKPGKLTDEEYDQIKLHPEIGHAILRDIPQLEDVLPGVLYHHERVDGRGYPFGIEGEDIPMMARVIGLADAFDAMSSSRTYRAAMPRSKVLSEIHKGAGTQFDAELAERFLMIDLSRYDEMVARHHAQAGAGEKGKAA